MSNTPRADRAAFSIQSKDHPERILVVPLALAQELEHEARNAIRYESVLRDMKNRIRGALEEGECPF